MAQPNTRIEPYEKRLAAAVYFWKKLQERQVHPDGSFDKGGRFYPSDEEREPCCDSIRSPSRSFPYSYMVHCRSMGHVAQKFGVAPGDMRKECHACATMSARTYKSKRMGKISKHLVLPPPEVFLGLMGASAALSYPIIKKLKDRKDKEKSKRKR